MYGQPAGLDWRSDEGERGRQLLVALEDVAPAPEQVGEGQSLREERPTARAAC